VATFEELPFDAQLAWIERETRTVGDATELVRRAAALPDVEPLCRLMDRLAQAGASRKALVGWYRPNLEELSDPALQYLLGAALHHGVAQAARRDLAREAASAWPLSRATALALLYRWLTDEDPDAARELRATAAERIAATSTSADPRWLFFLSGAELATLAEDPAWSAIVRETTHHVLGRLAHAPKSLSQANAEGLLSRQVYADPGHFLFELMQNADDAGACEWRVEIGAGQTVVTHDGAPFSFLDVVGICSIGLTTKGRDAIGLFGVGFKSVFEVTDRPRIHSGAFHFEIAHVSMPRPIAPEPGDGQTVVLLPHRGQVDADALSERARAIPPETLLTLPHLRRLTIEGADHEVAIHEQERDGTRTALRTGDAVRYYACAQETVALGSASSPVLVAAAMDADGSLEPRAEPGLFAFLPTAERTGLPVLVHARFDVTVDRERLETGSENNRALLACAGRQYALLIARAASEGHSVLGALPIERELTELARPLADVLRQSLMDVPCLPIAGGLVTPAKARMVDARLAEPFRELDLGAGERALTALSQQAQDKARFLGARPFDDGDLHRLLLDRLQEGAAAPAWLGSAVQRVLAESALTDEALRALPILETSDGTLSTAKHARVAEASWAKLYAGIRPLISYKSLEAIDGRLRQRLAVEPFRSEELVDDLGRYPQLGDRESSLLGALADASDTLIDRLREVPLFRGVDDERHAIADGIRRLAPRLEELRDALSPWVLLASPSAERAHPDLFRRAMPCFDLPDLIDAMLSSSEEATLAQGALRGLAAVLDAATQEAPGLSSTMARRGMTLPVFEDEHGVMRPLVGLNRALIAADAALLQLFPEWPWLAAPEAPFVRTSQPPPFGARALLAALGSGELLTAAELKTELKTERSVKLIGWLGAHAGEFTASDVDAMALLTIWPDVVGAPHRLEHLRLASAEETIERFYAATGLRRVAHAEAVTTCRQLRMDHALVASQYETAIADLLSLEDPASIGMSVVWALIRAASPTVSTTSLTRLLELPIFEDEAGTLRHMGSWNAPDLERSHRPGVFRELLVGTSWPVLSKAAEDGLATFFARVEVASANAGDVARLGADLAVPPAALLAVLVQHADELDASSREAVRPLSLFASRSGALAPAAELAFADALLGSLGTDQVAALELDDSLMTDAARASCEKLGLAPRAHASVVVDGILTRLVEGAPLQDQPAGARSRDDLSGLLQLAVEADVDIEAHALGLDVEERLVRGRLLDAADGVRALAVQLPLAPPVADAAWAEDERARPLLDPISARMVAAALKALGAKEYERSEHPVLRHVEAVFAWIRAHGHELEKDDVARAALGSARVMPSQRGTLRAPNELVLSGAAPELGLAWGLAEDVPADVAAWLSDHYELDRPQRKALVDHVLDGVDEAVKDEDADRVVELVRFLAASLGAGRVAPEELDRRVRRLKVRARLRVPATDGTFVKPRFGWAPTAAAAALAHSFMQSPPDRVGSELADVPSRTLLAACGAASDLADEDVEALLDGEGLRSSPQARVALARYVAQRALSSGSLIARWDLNDRAWVPDRGGELRRPADLLWPEPAVRALFGDDAGAVPEDSVVSDLPHEAGAKLGFLSVETLSPKDIAERLGDRQARTELLMVLESGLAQGRFTRQALRRALRERLTIRDDEGVVRPVTEVSVRGSRELFGHARGDASILRQTPLLARALSIPDEPDLAMMLAFLQEHGVSLPSLSVEARRDLARHVPEIYRHLASRSRKGTQFSLPAGAAVVALHAGERRLFALTYPDLRLAEPSAVADELAQADLDGLVLLTEVAPALRPHLLEAGVTDLLTGATLDAVEPGVQLPDREADAERLHGALLRGLGRRVGRRVDVRERLSTTYLLALPTGPLRVTVETDAAVHDDTLFVNAAALAEPALIAAALETEPRRRASLVEWLSGDLRDAVSKRPAQTLRQPEIEPSEGWLSQVWRFLAGKDAAPSDDARPDETTVDKAAAPTTSRRKKPAKQAADPQRDAAMFRPQHEIGTQLEGGEGWVEARAKRPAFGFRFTPESLPSPWLYAPKIVATEFDQRSQSWQPSPLERPESRGNAGTVRLLGSLPAGDSVMPIPLYGRLTGFTPAEASCFPTAVGSMVRLDHGAAVTMDVVLGVAPDASAARVSSVDATRSFVPDGELPEEVLAFVEDLEPASPLATAKTIRDFVRRRYRYDPTYLEDASVGRWLARVARGRAHAHVAALHAGADGEYLGAGVCHELNSVTCELLRRASIPAGIATGWVFTGGGLSEPDHLWVNVFLEGPRGEPIWVPIDASTTARGRPLRVARRPQVRTKRLASKRQAPPREPGWASSEPMRRTARGPGSQGQGSQGQGSQGQGSRGQGSQGQGSQGQGSSRSKQPRRPARTKKERSPPRAELRRLVHYLERRTGREVTAEDKRELEAALQDPRGMVELLERLRGKP
jgi:Transglutaminase-like superfamily